MSSKASRSVHFLASVRISLETLRRLHAVFSWSASWKIGQVGGFSFRSFFSPLMSFFTLCSVCLQAFLCIQGLSQDTIKEDYSCGYRQRRWWSPAFTWRYNYILSSCRIDAVTAITISYRGKRRSVSLRRIRTPCTIPIFIELEVALLVSSSGLEV